MPKQGICERCKYISSMRICKACVMLEGLNKGLPKLGIGKSSKVKGQMKILEGKDEICRSDGGAKSGCASQREGKQVCCGRGGGCSKEEKVDDPVQDTEPKVKQGKQRSLKKRRQARERINATGGFSRIIITQLKIISHTSVGKCFYPKFPRKYT